MANLDRLMSLGGAVAAGEFTPSGDLVSYRGNLPEDAARLIAKVCAANTLMGDTEVDSLTRLTGMKWRPFHGWAISAGDYSVCVIGHIGVFVETSKANFGDIYRVLGEEAHVTLKAAA
jgi:roadblock/LC7 domain-containing protein